MSTENAPSAPEKKGLGAGAWIAIGCGGVLLLVAFAVMTGGWFLASKVKEVAEDYQDNPVRATAELAVRFNPALELVDSDEHSMTIREQTSGETLTVRYEDWEKGKFSLRNDQGELMTVDLNSPDGATGEMITFTDESGEVARFGVLDPGLLPPWVPGPGFSDADDHGLTAMVEAEDHVSGHGWMTSDADRDEVAAYFTAAMTELGLPVNRSESSGPEGRMLTLSGQEGGRSFTVALTDAGDGVRSLFQFSATGE